MLIIGCDFHWIWVPSEEERDVRQLLMDRHHRMRARTQVKNRLQSLALNQGLVPGEYSWGNKQRLGHISKQGSSLMRFLLVEAGQTAVRGDEQLRRAYARLAAKKSRAVAKVMVARRLAVRLYWMLRRNCTYAELARHAGEPGSFCGER
jgi:transposase